MAIKHQEALDKRVDNLKAHGLNGFKMILVTLHPDANPTEAHLEVHFCNNHEIANILGDSQDPKRIFPISGGQRITAGSASDQVKVVSISGDPTDTSLRLTVAPIGNYSTYTLSIDYQNIDPIFNELDFKFRPGCFNLCAPDWEPAPKPKEEPIIDYLAKDYDSFRHTMIAAMMERVPGWQPTSEADLDQVLLELFSGAADELSDYQDRVMNEAYLGTARKRVSLARHARLMDYHIHQGNQASTRLALELADDEVFVLPKNFLVWTGNDINDPSSVVFIVREEKPPIFSIDLEFQNDLNIGSFTNDLRRKFEEDDIILSLNVSIAVKTTGSKWVVTDEDTQQRYFIRKEESQLKVYAPHLHHLLNQMELYTWSDSIPALAKGSTSADLKLSVNDQSSTSIVQNAIREGNVKYLLVQEWLNPATGKKAGRDPTKRQLLKLLPGDKGAEAMQDPLTGDWFVRVFWEEEDKLKRNYCFTIHCPVPKGNVENVSLFHGNLVEVYHGRSLETVFKDPETEKLFLFNMELSFQNDLDNRNFSDDLRNEFEKHGITLSLNIDISVGIGNKWLIREQDTEKRYVIMKIEDRLEVYILHPDYFLNYERTQKWDTICKLPEAPLAYKDTPLGGEVPPESTLEVIVKTPGGGSDRWDEVISLVHSDTSDENGDHFVVETDEMGQSLIRFGNDSNGKELPDKAVVHCRYQIGRGLDGNIGAEQLSNFDNTAFPEIATCWNPFDVTGGRDPEPAAEIIRRVPEAYRSRQLRAVTLQDYVNRAEELDEVSKAAARYVWTGSWRAVRIAIDLVGTIKLKEKEQQERLCKKIARHLEAVRLIGEDLEIRLPQFVPLEIDVSLCIHPEYWPEDIEDILEQAFSDGFTPDGSMGFFHPDQWTFGQELRASQIIGQAQSIRGVDHVIAVSLKRWNEVTPGTSDLIEVRPNEIIQVKNDPDYKEEGTIFFDVKGGRQ